MQPTIELGSALPVAPVMVEREHRVRFKHPVRVVPIGGPPRAYRVLAGNLSRKGIFLKMPTPLSAGTRVALSLEAGGRVLPFAQGEVVWRKLADRTSGLGVRFTGFLHPRAHELVDYLVKNLETGRPLRPPPAKGRWAARLAWLVAGAAAVALGAASTSFALRSLRAAEVAEAPVAVAAAAPAPASPSAPVEEVAPPMASAAEVAAVVVENAPRSVEVALRSQQEGQRLVLHLINFIGEMTRPIRKVVPLRDVRITLTTETEVNRIFTLMLPQQLAAQKGQSGRTQFTVPQVNECEVIAIEK